MKSYGHIKILGMDEHTTLLEGDCREYFWMRRPPTPAPGAAVEPADLDKIHTVITDIPYGEASDSARGGGRERYRGQLREVGKGSENARTFDDEDIVRWLLMSDADSYYVFCSTEQAGILRRDFQAAGLSTRTGVWIKTNPSPANGQHLWVNAAEVLIFAREPRAFFHEDYHCKPLVWHEPVVHHSHRVVKTQKPVQIVRDMMIASTPPGGMVLDPFMGGGTVPFVARSEGFKCIGIELNARRAKAAKERIGW